MKKLFFIFWIFLFVFKSFSQEPPVVLPYMYEFIIPNDSRDSYEKSLTSKYGYCTPDQITELANAVTTKNNDFDKQFNEVYNKYKGINDTLVALLEANDIDLLNNMKDSLVRKKEEVYKNAVNNVKNIYYTSLHIVIVTADFMKYSRAELDSIAQYKAYSDGIQKFCNTSIYDSSIVRLNPSGGVDRNMEMYRSLSMEIKGNAKSGTNVADILSYQPDRDFFFKVYEVQTFPFSKTTLDYSLLNNFNNKSSTNTLYSIVSFDVFSPSQSLSDFLQQQKKKYNLFDYDIDRILNFCNKLKLEIPDKNKEQCNNEKEEVKKIQDKIKLYDKKIEGIKNQIEDHKKIIKRIIANQTEGKCIYSETNIHQTIKTAIDYFNSKLNSFESQLQEITQKKYYTDIISFKSSTQGKTWELIFEQMKSGNNTNNLKTIEQRIGADIELYKKINVIISSDNTGSNTTTVIKKMESITYKRKLSRYWLYLQLDPPTGNININVISLCTLLKNSPIKEEDKVIDKNELPPALLKVTIKSIPSGASATISGKTYSTPCTLNLTEGKYNITLKYPDYFDTTRIISVNKYNTLWNFNLRKKSETIPNPVPNESACNLQIMPTSYNDLIYNALMAKSDDYYQLQSIKSYCKKELSDEELYAIYKSMSNIADDYYKELALTTTINLLPKNDNIMNSFFNQVATVRDDYYQLVVIQSIAKKKLTKCSIISLLNSLSMISDNFYLDEALQSVCWQLPQKDNDVMTVFYKQLNRINDDFYKQSVINKLKNY